MSLKHSPIALLYGFFGSNHGDRAVTRGSVELLRAIGLEGPLSVVTPPLSRHTRAGWMGTRKAYPALNLREFDHILRLLKHDGPPDIALAESLIDSPSFRSHYMTAAGLDRCDALFLGGGEQVFSYRTQDDWTMLSLLLPFFIALRCGKPCHTLPTTFGPFHTAFSKALFARFLAQMSTIAVRDAGSATLLKTEFGHDARIALDPAFFLATNARTRRTIPAGAARVALVPRLDNFGLRIGAAESSTRLAAQRKSGFTTGLAVSHYGALIEALGRYGAEVTIYIQAEADRELCAHLFSTAKASARPGKLKLVRSRSLDQFIRDLSFADRVVTSRFHAAIFCMLGGGLPIGLHFKGHGHKMPGMFDLLGESGLSICADDHSAQDVAQLTLNSLASDRDRGARLAEKVDSLRRRTLESYAALSR